MLEDMGVQYAFGVCEGAIALLRQALKHGFIRVLHFHHKARAAFAACQGYFATGRLVVVLTTTIPESAIALTGKPSPTQSPMQMFLHWGSLFNYVSTQQVQRATPVRFLSSSPSV
ncbi:hypothetical protein NIES2130_30185 [Scytonema sp. HK-05]|nr:hypothetical protein NIES2130_30185 [Scytonema sp. HK-05]